jgi:hypothetical protein
MRRTSSGIREPLPVREALPAAELARSTQCPVSISQSNTLGKSKPTEGSKGLTSVPTGLQRVPKALITA